MKLTVKIVLALALLYVGYDYYQIRQHALCAHNAVHSGSK